MVSWLVEVLAWNNGTFPDTFNMIGGVMLSGGSYTCCEYPYLFYTQSAGTAPLHVMTCSL